MVLRKRILLDAFKTSPQGVMPGASKAAAEQAAAARSIDPKGVSPGPKVELPAPKVELTGAKILSSGAPASRPAPAAPIAPGRPTAKSPPPAREQRPRTGILARAVSDRVVQTALVLFLVGISLAYWLGQKSTAEVAAAPHAGGDAATNGALVRPSVEKPIPRAGSELAEQNSKIAANGTAHERAFMDKANKYTLRLIQYKNDEAGLKAARAACDVLLNREGLPVVGPIVRGEILLVCAGYASKQPDLDSLRTYVRELRGVSNKNDKPFAGAYVVNIDDVIRR
jgi:hypothetical protein